MSENLYCFLLVIILFFFLLPPFTLFFNYSVFNTHNLVKILLVFWFFYFLKKSFLYIKNRFSKLTELEFFLILFFFITQSFSIINAINPQSFITRYEKVMSGMFLFLLLLKPGINKKRLTDRIIFVFFISSAVKLFFELVLYFDLFNLSFYSNFFLHPHLYKTIIANLKRGRVFLDLFQEVNIPFFIYLFLRKRNTLTGKMSMVFLFLIGIASFLSNWRGRVINFFVTIMLVIYMFKKNININAIKLILVIFFFLILTGYFNYYQRFYLKVNILDRFSTGTEESISTIEWRKRMFDEAYGMGKTSLFGVGLGNFYDNLPFSIKNMLRLKTQDIISKEAALSGPHNIFYQYLAESGLIGLFSFIALLSFFLMKDIFLFKKYTLQQKAFFIAFWSLILAGNFYPAIDLSFYTLFFVLRAMLI